MTSTQENPMQAPLKLEGEHAHLASTEELAAAIKAAREVFSRLDVDPLACAVASQKLAKDEPLTQEEALLSVIWDTAEDKAFRAATLGWLIRDIDIRLAVEPVS
jgi:hypothetical protein